MMASGHAGWSRLVLMLAGASAGFAIARTAPQPYDSSWILFVLATTVLGAASADVFVAGLRRWKELRTITAIGPWVLPGVIALLVAAAAFVYIAPMVLAIDLSWRGLVIPALPIVGALPGGATLAGIHWSTRQPLPGSVGAQLDALLRLRRLLSRLMTSLGLLVLLLVLVNAIGIGRRDADSSQLASAFIGVAGSAVVGLMFIPAATSVRRRAGIFVDEVFPLTTVTVEDLIRVDNQRAQLESRLGLDRTTLAEMRAGLVIMAPTALGGFGAVIGFR